MSNVELLEETIKKLHERVIMLEQLVKVSSRTSEPDGTTTVGGLSNISDAQLGDNPLLYTEHPDGGFNVYLSQIITKAQENIPAENLTGEVDPEAIPPAVNSGTAGSGFGGFRYVKEGTTLKLFVS
ncbi:hypothetical protein SN11_16880 [Vibrio harveyi]|nr:hypothetical protein SN11_16880 [Vibrio harveyi]